MILGTYQENDRDVERKGDSGVQEKGDVSNARDIRHRHIWDLNDKRDHTVHYSASRSEVVEGNQGVHLELCRGKQALNHGQADSLKHDTANLEEESSENEFNLAEGSDDDTDNDDGHVAEGLQIGWCNAQGPACEKHSNWSGGLAHSLASDV